MDDNKICFIVGIERSGTTMVSYMFNEHPKVIASPEIQFLIFFYHKYALSHQYITKQFVVEMDEYINLFRKSSPLTIWHIDSKELIQHLEEHVGKMTYAQACMYVYHSFYLNNKKKSDYSSYYIVNQNPVYSLYIPEITSIYPNAKFIWMIRDYRDQISSKKSSLLEKQQYLGAYAHKWNSYQNYLNSKYNKYRNNILVVSYEELCRDPNLWGKKMFDFLNLEFDSSFLNFSNTVQSATYDSSTIVTVEKIARAQKKFGDLGRQINVNGIGVYKTKLTEQEINLLEYICNFSASQFGYLSSKGGYSMSLFFGSMVGAIINKIGLIKEKLIFRMPPKLKLWRLSQITK